MRGPISFLFALCLVNAQMNNSIIKLSTVPNLQWKPWATFPTHYLQPKSTSTAIPTIEPTPAASNVARLLVNCTEFMVIIVSLRFTPQPARKYGIMLLLIRTFVLPIFALGDASVQIGPTELFPKGFLEPPYDLSKICVFILATLFMASTFCCCCAIVLRCC